MSAEAKNAIQLDATKSKSIVSSILSSLGKSAASTASGFKMPSMTSTAKPDEVVKKLVELKIITPNASAPGYINILDRLISGTIKSPYEITKDDITDSTILGDIRYYIMLKFGNRKLPDGLSESQQTQIKDYLSDEHSGPFGMKQHGDSKPWYNKFNDFYNKIGAAPKLYSDITALSNELIVIDKNQSINTQLDPNKLIKGPFLIIATKLDSEVVVPDKETIQGSKYIIMDADGKLSDGRTSYDWGVKDDILKFKESGKNIEGGATKSRRRKSRKGTRRSR